MLSRAEFEPGPAEAPAGRRGERIAVLGNDLDYVASFRGPVIRRLLEQGHAVTVIAPVGSRPQAADALRAMGAGVIDWPLRKTSRNPFGDIATLIFLARTIRRLRPSVLYADTIKPVIFGMLVGRLMGVPRRVAMLPGLGYAFIDGGGPARAATRLAAMRGYGLVLPWAHCVIFHNRDDAELFHARRIVRDGARIAHVDGSGVDLDRFASQPAPSGPPVFAMISRLLRDKGVTEYVEAARIVRQRIPEARFLLVGGLDRNPAAIPEAQVRRWVEEGHIDYLGEVGDVRPVLAACHAFVLPSYREGLPRTCLEAMAAGRAVVTSDAPGCREVVRDGVNGRLAPPRDAAALAEALYDLARDPAAVRRMGEASRRLCEERFGLERVAARMADLIVGGPSALGHERLHRRLGLDEAGKTQEPREDRDRALAPR